MQFRAKKQSKNDAGFTLVEVALSATVMLFVIAGMLSAVTSGSEMLDTSNRMIVANNLITHHVNEMRLESWNTVSSLPSNRTLTVPNRFSTVASNMTLTRSVVHESDSLSRLTFTVTWNGITGRSHTTTSEAVFTKNGLSASYGY